MSTQAGKGGGGGWGLCGGGNGEGGEIVEVGEEKARCAGDVGVCVGVGG